MALRLLQGGRSLAEDVRSSEIGAGKSWEFEVHTDLVQEDLTLSWPNLGSVPSGYEARLEDLSTGREVYARTRGGYTYNSGQGGTRRFRLTVAPRGSAPLNITGLAVQRTRGVPSVRFSLTRDAVVSVEVSDPTGNVRQRLATEHMGRAGLNVVSAGRSDGLGAGLYLIQVTATASDGATARAVSPMVVVR